MKITVEVVTTVLSAHAELRVITIGITVVEPVALRLATLASMPIKVKVA